jgi:hypothetical protein
MIDSSKKSSVLNTVKLWVFPSVVTLLAMMIWRDVNELRSDVKQLLAESNSNKAKVENLEKQVQQLNQAVFKIPRTAGNFPEPTDNHGNINQMYAILNKDEYNIVKKYVPYKTN